MDAGDVEPATATFDFCNANFEIGARTKVATCNDFERKFLLRT